MGLSTAAQAEAERHARKDGKRATTAPFVPAAMEAATQAAAAAHAVAQ